MDTLQPPPPVTTDHWTDLFPDTDHARAFISHDWAATEVGPLTAWPLELRLYTIKALTDLSPVCIWWYSSPTLPVCFCY